MRRHSRRGTNPDRRRGCYGHQKPGMDAGRVRPDREGAMDIIDVQHEVAAALPVVREHAAAAERARRLPDEVVDALRATGINRLLLPEEAGGLDAPVVDIVGMV